MEALRLFLTAILGAMSWHIKPKIAQQSENLDSNLSLANDKPDFGDSILGSCLKLFSFALKISAPDLPE